ncbi:MAG: hypothetical protein ACYDGN_17215 [Acidimicrobiales bacterium]
MSTHVTSPGEVGEAFSIRQDGRLAGFALARQHADGVRELRTPDRPDHLPG